MKIRVCDICKKEKVSILSAKSSGTRYPLMNTVLRGTTQCGLKLKYAKIA